MTDMNTDGPENPLGPLRPQNPVRLLKDDLKDAKRIGPDNLPDKSWYLSAFFLTLLLAPVGLVVTFGASIYMLTRNLIAPAIAMWASSIGGLIAAFVLMAVLNS